MNDPFADIVGQDKVKSALRFHLSGYHRSRLLPHMMFVAPKGQGKTNLARAVAKGLTEFDENGKPVQIVKEDGPVDKLKSFVEINCASIKNIAAFINTIVVPYIQDKDVTVLFDEASELPKDVSMALLSILAPSKENRNTFTHGEYICEFDFRRQSFLFATSEIHKVFGPVIDRTERITLEEYNTNQMAQIVAQGLKDVTFEDDVLMQVAGVLRGNARDAVKMANKIQTYLGDTKVFTKLDWLKIRQALGIRLRGLNELEIQVLLYLFGNPSGTSLTALAAKTGMSRESLQKDIELFLQKHGLMVIETSGRQITSDGIKYLAAMVEDDKMLAAV